MIVRVVNVRNVGWADGKNYLYVGRPMTDHPGHPLANPYRVPPGASEDRRREVLALYITWLDALPNRDKLLQALADRVRYTGLPLGCWCGNYPENPDLLCHAVVLAQRVAAILEGCSFEGEPEAI